MTVGAGSPGGSLGQFLDRYRPVAITVGIAAVLLTVVPGVEVVSRDSPASIPSVASGDGDTVPSFQEGQNPAKSADVAAAEQGATGSSTSVPTGPPPASSEEPDQSLERPGTASDPGSVPSSPPAAPATTPGQRGSGSPASPEEEPLRPVISMWASASAGTPLATLGVPEETLPVGNRVGSVDKASYVQLTGTTRSLVLREDPDGRRGSPTASSVQACQIIDRGWSGGEAKSFDDAPEYDADVCIPGARSDDGVWSFDLSSFETPADDRGFALVPSPDAPVDFQVAFARS